MIEYLKMQDRDRANPERQEITELDAGNLQLRLVQDYGAVIVTSNKRFIRYRAGAVEHVFVKIEAQPLQRGLEGLGLFDGTLAGANQLALL